MAPRKLRTYGNNKHNAHRDVAAKTADVELLQKISTTSNCNYKCSNLSASSIIADNIFTNKNSYSDPDSIKAPWTETTFDRIRRGPIYNVVCYKSTQNIENSSASSTNSLHHLSSRSRGISRKKQLPTSSWDSSIDVIGNSLHLISTPIKTLRRTRNSCRAPLQETNLKVGTIANESNLTAPGEGFATHSLIIEPEKSHPKNVSDSLFNELTINVTNDNKASRDAIPKNVPQSQTTQNYESYYGSDKKSTAIKRDFVVSTPVVSRFGASTPMKDRLENLNFSRISPFCSPLKCTSDKSVQAKPVRQPTVLITQLEHQPEFRQFIQPNYVANPVKPDKLTELPSRKKTPQLTTVNTYSRYITRRKAKLFKLGTPELNVNEPKEEIIDSNNGLVLCFDQCDSSICDESVQIIEPPQELMETSQKTPGLVEPKSDSVELINASGGPTESIFLKPGKHWKRSLTILRASRNFQTTSPKQKGRKWRESVIEVWGRNTGACIRAISPKTTDVNAVEADGECTNKAEEPPPNSAKRFSFRIVKAPEITKRALNESYRIGDDGIQTTVPVELYPSQSLLHRTEGYVSNVERNIEDLDGIFTNLSLSLTENAANCSSVENKTRDKLEWDSLVPITARDIVLQRCKQIEPLDFDLCYPERTLQKCHKIGEGVYGEVFLLKNTDGTATVLKVIPIEGDILVNGENQKKYDEILSEIIIAQELSSLRSNYFNQTSCFVNVQAVRCVRGRYPTRLIELWELYDEDKGSENDHPEIFTDDQLYIVLELAHGGRDLESFQFLNAEQSYAIFVQTAYTLAVAECALKFEHRDLHWGNVLISPTDDKDILFILNGEPFSVPSRGLKVSIIDFTLSRVTYENCCIYNDLAKDPDLFKSHGDYQFEVYKLMQRKNHNEWERFEPYTNILWLHYVILKMVDGAHYSRSKSLKHARNLKLMQDLANVLLASKSADEFITVYLKK